MPSSRVLSRMRSAVVLVTLFVGVLVHADGTTSEGALAMTFTLLQRPRSNSEAVMQANLLQEALIANRAGTLQDLFAAWSLVNQERLVQPEVSFEAFERSVDTVVRHNLGAQEGSWSALNHLSALPHTRLRMALAVSAASTASAAAAAPPPSPRPPPPLPSVKPPSPKPISPPVVVISKPPPPSPAPKPKPPAAALQPKPPAPKPPSPALKPMPPLPPKPPSPVSQSTPKPPPPRSPPRPSPRAPAPRASDMFTTRLKGAGSTNGLVFPPPQYVNWTQAGKTTAIKDQGVLCASCWANSAISAVESALAIVYGVKPTPMSRQILIDCANFDTLGTDYLHDVGCSGGDVTDALFFMMSWSVPTEVMYPYTAAFGSWSPNNCNTSMMALPVKDPTWLQISGIKNYPAHDEQSLQAAVAIQPVVIYWCLGFTWSSYGGGVYSRANQNDPSTGCSNDPYNTDHAMLLVGFNTKVTPQIWIVQNSFGSGWGEQGFARVEMTGDKNGPCGMYGFVIAPSLNFKRAPPSLVHSPPPPTSAAAPPPPACKNSSDPTQCSVIKQYDLCDFVAGISAKCPCWCAKSPPPPQASPPPPPLSAACAKEAIPRCQPVGLNSVAVYQKCLKDVQFRAACPCTCEGVGYCAKEDQGVVACYDKVVASGNLTAFCVLDRNAKDALFCPCWCLNIRPKPPLAVNWKTRAKLTAVKDVGDNGCDSDWALASVAAVEAAMAIAYPQSTPINLSQQLLLDCANYVSAGERYVRLTGCRGGYPDDALLFMSNFSIPTAALYPYVSDGTGASAACRPAYMYLQNSANFWVQTTGYWSVSDVEESMLMAAVAVQPIVALFFLGANFYSGGIYTKAQQKDSSGCINDATDVDVSHPYAFVYQLIVGYNNQSIPPLWVLQFNYGPSWGENGFARVEMSHDQEGPCGLYSFIAAPDLSFVHVPSTVSMATIAPDPPRPLPRPPSPPFATPSPPKAEVNPFYAMSGPMIGHQGRVNCVAFTPDSSVLTSGSDDGTVRTWDVATAAPFGSPLGGATGGIYGVTISANGDNLASASADGAVRIYSTDTGVQVCPPLVNHTAVVVSVAFSPSGAALASASYDKSIILWAPFSCRRIGMLLGHTAGVTSVAFEPSGKRLVSGSFDKTLRLWDIATTQQAGPSLVGHTDFVNSVAFSPDGGTIASGSNDFTIRLWVAATGAPLMGPLIGHTSVVTSVAFSPDGKYLVSASADGTLRLWNPKTGKQIGAPLLGHSNFVLSAVFSPDSQWIASASADLTVRLWGFPSPTCVDFNTKTCDGWARSGYCNLNVTYGNRVVATDYCPRSCNLCGICRDWTGSCTAWNAQGLCASGYKSNGQPIGTYWCPGTCGNC